MAWVNYREIMDRFSHIDAELVRFITHANEIESIAELTVSFYPWWEHPLYLEAIRRGDSWGFSGDELREQELTVRAIRPSEVKFSPVRYVIDLEFTQEDPLIWSLRNTMFFINSPLDREQLLEGLLQEVPKATRQYLAGYLLPSPLYSAPYALAMPSRFHEPALRVFAQLRVEVFCPHPPSPGPEMVAFYFDGGHIIAEDFEVNVPDFIHRPEWFSSKS
jgi:hypothetical protein